MLEFFSDLHYALFLKLLLALVLGIIIGIERKFAGKMAGGRTYGLVSLGSALFIIISEIMVQKYAGIVDVSPMRIASQILTGVGFLGAGMIIFKNSYLRGLTSAAGLWVSSGIGMAVGFGLYDIAIFVTILTFITFNFLWRVEDKLIKKFDDDEDEGPRG